MEEDQIGTEKAFEADSDPKSSDAVTDESATVAGDDVAGAGGHSSETVNAKRSIPKNKLNPTYSACINCDAKFRCSNDQVTEIKVGYCGPSEEDEDDDSAPAPNSSIIFIVQALYSVFSADLHPLDDIDFSQVGLCVKCAEVASELYRHFIDLLNMSTSTSPLSQNVQQFKNFHLYYSTSSIPPPSVPTNEISPTSGHLVNEDVRSVDIPKVDDNEEDKGKPAEENDEKEDEDEDKEEEVDVEDEDEKVEDQDKDEKVEDQDKDEKVEDQDKDENVEDEDKDEKGEDEDNEEKVDAEDKEEKVDGGHKEDQEDEEEKREESCEEEDDDTEEEDEIGNNMDTDEISKEVILNNPVDFAIDTDENSGKVRGQVEPVSSHLVIRKSTRERKAKQKFDPNPDTVETPTSTTAKSNGSGVGSKGSSASRNGRPAEKRIKLDETPTGTSGAAKKRKTRKSKSVLLSPQPSPKKEKSKPTPSKAKVASTAATKSSSPGVSSRSASKSKERTTMNSISSRN